MADYRPTYHPCFTPTDRQMIPLVHSIAVLRRELKVPTDLPIKKDWTHTLKWTLISKIMTYLRAHGPSERQEIARHLGISEDQARYLLREAVAEGKIMVYGDTKRKDKPSKYGIVP